jgi:hypothetical protein
MGSSEDVMRGFVNKELQVKFPRYEGWDLQTIKSRENEGFLFLVSRYNRGKNEFAIISASLKQKPGTEELSAIKADQPNRRTLVGRFLITPQGADLSAVPAHIGVLPMSSFGFIDGELAWLTKKKNAPRYPVGGDIEA